MIKNGLKIFLVIGFTCLLGIGGYYFLAPSTTNIGHANHILHSKDELVKSSELIVVAQPENNSEDGKSIIKYEPTNGHPYDFYTLTNVKIMKVIKGNIEPNTVLPVANFEGYEKESFKKAKKVYKTDETISFDKNKKYLLFLSKDFDGNYRVISINQGIFEASKDSNITNNTQYNNLRNDIIKKYEKDLQ